MRTVSDMDFANIPNILYEREATFFERIIMTYCKQEYRINGDELIHNPDYKLEWNFPDYLFHEPDGDRRISHAERRILYG